ncbi:hypothetical protein NW768_004809 [Fusarium equiseti]|uniref:Transcription factor domain-containing protein n=1 Tax=Fusarium equiseti TaxID=61235 RepID=A0ABQ8RHD7_FUSEQ|nr:hypothetical protein NW768_004809 [Fusarium equiseti]
MDLFGAFQAYLVYSLVLLFKCTYAVTPAISQAMFNLQEIARVTCRQGLACTTEQTDVAYPQWEAWHLVEAKRRTLYTMYLLDDSLSIAYDFPTFISLELEALYAPSSKELWQANRTDWEQTYESHCYQWGTNGLRVGNLWPVPPNTKEDNVQEMEEARVQWLMDADEYGMMLFAVTSSTNES